MKEIKVFLRLGKRPHTIYYDLLKYPPKDIIFKYNPLMKFPYEEKVSILHQLKVKLWSKYLKKNPPAAWINKKGCDVIHSTNNIMALNKSPWVMDIELLLGLFSFNPARLEKNQFQKVKKILNSEYCKKLMPYTYASKESLINSGMKELNSKMEVIYPAKKVTKEVVKPDNDKVRVLWAGRNFLSKGGYNVLKIFDELKDRKDLIFIMLGPTPEELRMKYSKYKNIKFIENKTHDNILWEEFTKSDIFLYPTNLDSYGLAMLDSMNYKTPIIVTDLFSSKEIVEEGKNGFIVKHPLKWHNEKFQMIYPSFQNYLDKLKNMEDKNFIKNMCDKIINLVEDKKLRIRMGKEGRNMVLSGKFSIEERNKKLRRVYEEAIR